MVNRTRTESHEKSMGSYELFAWRDAMSIASILDSEFELAEARKIFKGIPIQTVIQFEIDNAQSITDFIKKPESQRLGFLNRATQKDAPFERVLFLVLAIIGAERAMRVMELRDRFRTALVPGLGNRVTTAAMYDFSNKVFGMFSFSWPSNVFEAMGCDDGSDEEE